MRVRDRGRPVWVEKGYLTLAVALALTAMIAAQVVYLVAIGATGGVVTYSLFLLVGLHATTRSVQEVRERRTDRSG